MTGATARRPSILLIFAITITGVTVNTLVSPAIPDIIDGLGASRSLAGLVIAAATFPGVLLAPVIGILADRYGRKAVLIPCLVVYGTFGVLAALSPNIWVFVGLRLAQGAGAAGLVNLGVVLIGDYWEGPERARRIGWNAAVLTVAVAVFPPLGGALADLGGWQAPFFVYPVAIVTAVAVARLLPPSERRDVSVRSQLADAVPYLKMPEVIGMLVAGVVTFVLIFGVFLTIMPLYAEAEFGLAAGARGLLLSLPAITSTVGSLLLGRLSQRFSRRVLVTSACGIFVVSLLGIAWAPGLLLLGTAILVFGLGQGIVIPTLQDLAAGVAPDESRGTLVAAWVSAARSGQTIGPLLASASLTAVGASRTFTFGAGIAGALALLVAVGSSRVRPSGPPEPAPPPV